MIASTVVRPRFGRRSRRVPFTLRSTVARDPAHAQSEEERANARAAAGAGADAFDAGNYQKSADYFERAETLVHSPVHLGTSRVRSKSSASWSRRASFVMRVVREGTKGASSGVLAANDGCQDILKGSKVAFRP